MKKVIKVTDTKTGKVTTGQVELRNKDHFEVQLHNKAVVFTPKKGKGSYKRSKRFDKE